MSESLPHDLLRYDLAPLPQDDLSEERQPLDKAFAPLRDYLKGKCPF